MKYLILSLLLGLFTFLIIIFIWRKKYTREKFAFHAFASLLTFATVTILPLFAGHSIFSILEDVLRQNFSMSIVSSSTIYDKLLSFFVFVSLIWLASKLHSNWDGPISERTFQNKRRGIKTGLLEDAVAQSRSLKHKKPLELHQKQEFTYRQFAIESQLNFDKKRRIANLLMAYSEQYRINIDEEWHSEHESFITKYGKENLTTLIYCPTEELNTEDIANSLQFANSLEKKVSKLIIVADNLSSLNSISNKYDSLDIKTFTEQSLLDKISEIPNYSAYITDFFDHKKLSTTNELTLNDIYVSSAGIIKEKTKIKSVEEYIINWLRSDTNHQIALLGEYGQGKSTLSYRLAYDYFNNNRKFDRIPIILELRGKSPRTMSIEELLFSWTHKYGLNHSSLLALHEAGRILLILEGFDEMDFVGDTEIRLSHFRSLWQFAAFENAKILVTGRPNFFFDTNELERALLINESTHTGPRCEAIRLLPFDKCQIEKAIRKFPKKTQESLLEIVENEETSKEFKDLLSRPSTLFWAANIWEELQPQIKTGNILSASVIGLFLNQCFDRQKNKKLQTTILEAEREYFTIGIAIAMHKESPGANQINAYNLKEIVEKLIGTVPPALQDFTSITEFKYVEFSERIKDPNRRLETVLTDVRTCGILVEDISRPGYFRFAHKSFYEYLVSLFLAYNYLFRIKDDSLRDSLEKDKIAISINVIKNVIEPSSQAELLLAYSYQEISQFAGQIFVEKLSLYKNFSTPEELHRFLLPGILKIASSTVRGVLNFPIPKIFHAVMLFYLTPFINPVFQRLKVFLYACKAMNCPEKDVSCVVGEKMYKYLMNEVDETNYSERRISRIFGNSFSSKIE